MGSISKWRSAFLNCTAFFTNNKQPAAPMKIGAKAEDLALIFLKKKDYV